MKHSVRFLGTVGAAGVVGWVAYGTLLLTDVRWLLTSPWLFIGAALAVLTLWLASRE